MATQKTCRVVSRNPKIEHDGWIEECFGGTKEYAAFYGIRYAAKPEGENRFKAPVPLTSEEALRLRQREPVPSSSQEARAALIKKSSLQNSPVYDKGSTDCLVLNVYTPQDPNHMNKRLPVLVFIHGGGFKRGSSNPNILSPEAIVQFGVVFVTMNYRLGTIGFLNLRTPEFPGNVGLKDQVQALKWIRDNIECFKGDPENVTISGWSAGATCVNFHLVSPMSHGLFHKAILHSGGVFFPWGYKGHNLEQKKAFAGHEEFFSLVRDEGKSREVCRQADRIISSDRRDRHSVLKIHPAYGGIVEKEKEGAFLSEDIESAMKHVQPKIPVMAGITKNESLEMFFECTVRGNKLVRDMCWRIHNDKEFEKFLMDYFRWSKETAEMNRDKIRKAYFPHLIWSEQALVNGYLNLLNDTCVRRFYDCFKFGPDKTFPENFFVYRFDHVSEISGVNYHRRSTYKLPSESTHGDDVGYLYDKDDIRAAYKKSIREKAEERNTEMLEVMKRMCSLWASFCTTGEPKSIYDPNLKWERHSKETPHYLSISNQLVLKDGSLLNAKCRWLNYLVDAYPPVQSEKSSPESV